MVRGALQTLSHACKGWGLCALAHLTTCFTAGIRPVPAQFILPTLLHTLQMLDSKGHIARPPTPRWRPCGSLPP